MIVVEITLKRSNGEVIAQVSGSAHEPMRWPPNGIHPIVDEEEGLQLLRVLYDPDSRPLPGKSDQHV